MLKDLLLPRRALSAAAVRGHVLGPQQLPAEGRRKWGRGGTFAGRPAAANAALELYDSRRHSDHVGPAEGQPRQRAPDVRDSQAPGQHGGRQGRAAGAVAGS